MSETGFSAAGKRFKKKRQKAKDRQSLLNSFIGIPALFSVARQQATKGVEAGMDFIAEDPVSSAKALAIGTTAGLADMAGSVTNAAVRAGMRSPHIPDVIPGRAGDPVREMVGLDPDNPQGQVMEMFSPGAAPLKATAAAGKLAAALPLAMKGRRVSRVDEFDPRFSNPVGAKGGPRVGQQDLIRDVEIGVEGRGADVPEISLKDLEGQPFVTSMADRTAAGDTLVDINGIPLSTVVDRQGGQDFMFNNPGQVWASARSPVSNIMNQARIVKEQTGIDPLYIPWRMAPTGSDFSTMTGEAMLGFASANMGKGAKRSLNAAIKKMIPGWKGVDDPESFGQWRATPDAVRKTVKDLMDKKFIDRGGLSIAEARAAITDPTQFTAREGGIQNVGRIEVERAVSNSSHPSYPFAVPGHGVGRVTEDVGIVELLPEFAKQRMIPDPVNPEPVDFYTMRQRGAIRGVITPEILQKLEERGVKTSAVPLAFIISAAGAYGLLGSEQAQAGEE